MNKNIFDPFPSCLTFQSPVRSFQFFHSFFVYAYLDYYSKKYFIKIIFIALRLRYQQYFRFILLQNKSDVFPKEFESKYTLYKRKKTVQKFSTCFN